jgi:hypothetical protein
MFKRAGRLADVDAGSVRGVCCEGAMQDRPSILLLDDGELDDIRELLSELGADVCALRGGAIPENLEPPEDLFIASARRALVASRWPSASGTGPAKLAVVAEDSNTARQMLRRLGFDYLVRRPVHHEALRLLLLHCLFRGEEKRREPRAVIGREVAYRVGLKRRTAILAELSGQGLRLVGDASLAPGTRVLVQFPGKLGGPFSVNANVVRAHARTSREGRSEWVLALAIDPGDKAGRKRMRELAKELRGGPLALTPPTPRPAGAPQPAAGERVAEATPPPAEPDADLEFRDLDEDSGVSGHEDVEGAAERRRHRRARFRRSVMAIDEARPRVLVGRDLSSGGMRVDPDPALAPGQRLRLAVYGAAREEPFLVRARVIRSDAKDGAALQFEELEPETVRRVEGLVALLPSVESLRDGEAGSVGTVVSEVLETES